MFHPISELVALEGGNTSPLDGAARVAYATNSQLEYVPEVAIGFGMSVVTKVTNLGPAIGGATGGIMDLNWVRGQLRRRASGGAMMDASKSLENFAPDAEVSSLKSVPLVIESNATQSCAIGLGACESVPATKSLKTGAVELASSLRIKEPALLPQRLTLESSLLAEEAESTTHTREALHPSSAELSGKMTEAVQSFNRIQTSEEHNFAPEPKSSCPPMADSSPSVVAEPTMRLVNSAPSTGSVVVLDKASTVSIKKSDSLLNRLEATFADAQTHAKIFEQQRSQRLAERDIADIESGCRRFSDPSQRQSVLEAAQAKKATADAALSVSGPPRYAQTLKKLHDFIRAAEACGRAETDDIKRCEFLRESLARLEELMVPIDKIWNGIPGKTQDLPRPGIRGKGEAPISADVRMSQIKEHLEAKINTVDGAQAQRVSVVKDNITFKEILKLHEAGELPGEGSLVFFTNDGMLLYQAELKVSQRSTQARAKDAASAQRHATNTPAFIDIARLDQGIGPEGAGLWRFIGQETRIIGAAVLRPAMKDGKLVELPGARNGRGEPMVKKEVAMIIGEVPPEVNLNMAYGHLLNTLRAKKIASERSASNTVSSSSMTALPASIELVGS